MALGLPGEGSLWTFSLDLHEERNGVHKEGILPFGLVKSLSIRPEIKARAAWYELVCVGHITAMDSARFPSPSGSRVVGVVFKGVHLM